MDKNTIGKADLLTLKDYIQKKLDGLPFKADQEQSMLIKETVATLAEIYQHGPFSVNHSEYTRLKEVPFSSDEINAIMDNRFLQMIESYAHEHKYW